jgi:N,N'-diacetyllegionaminate synthase
LDAIRYISVLPRIQSVNQFSPQENGCFVIAEAGSNHERKKENAFELIEEAAACGADAIKFQLFQASKLYSQIIGNDIYLRTKSVELPTEWIPELNDRCKSNRLMLIGSPFDFESVDTLIEINSPVLKWASGEINNVDLLYYAAKKNKPLIVSTGMSNLADIEQAISTVNSADNNQIYLLHCVSNYPTEPRDVNLRMMDTLKSIFEYPVGFSDHTLGTSISLAAAARGASILEKHFTLDKDIQSPDHPFSLRPKEFGSMVKSIREIIACLGDKQKKMIESEKPVAHIARRSLVANCDITRGTKITRNMVSAKRPGTGIAPTLISYILGATVSRDIKKDDIFRMSDFCYDA